MYCPKCFNEIDSDSLYCAHCGKKLKKKLKTKPSNTIAFGVMACIFAFVKELQIVSIIMGIIGINRGLKYKKDSKTPLAFSIVGLSIGSIQFIGTVFSVLLTVGYFLFYAFYYVFLIVMIILLENTPGNIPGEFFM